VKNALAAAASRRSDRQEALVCQRTGEQRLELPRPMRGLKRARSLQTIAAGHAFVQNLRRGHYEFVHDHPANDRVRIAFDALVTAVSEAPNPKT
jgi:hypothetical protein